MLNDIRQSGLIQTLIIKWLAGFIILSLLLLTACSDNKSRTIKTLHVAVLSDQNEKDLREYYQPLMRYIQSYIGLPVELIVPNSYSALLSMFERKEIDMALFGGVTYVKAHEKSDALPLVMRNVDGEFRSVALVRSNNTANSLDDIHGGILAFGSKLSTSGYYIPKYFLQKHNINIEAAFSEIKYSGAHDLTAEWVRDGKADVGMSNSGIVNQMFLDGRLNKNKIKVIWQSPPLYDYVWAVQSDIELQQINNIRNAFLSIGSEEKSMSLLQHLGADYYIPSSNDDFNEVKNIVKIIDSQVGAQ